MTTLVPRVTTDRSVLSLSLSDERPGADGQRYGSGRLRPPQHKTPHQRVWLLCEAELFWRPHAGAGGAQEEKAGYTRPSCGTVDTRIGAVRQGRARRD